MYAIRSYYVEKIKEVTQAQKRFEVAEFELKRAQKEAEASYNFV